MSEKIRKINGIEICTESFGNPTHPPVLLIMGAMCSMVYWDDEFCQGLADSGRYVIRFDNRDVGRTTTYPPGRSQYSVVDMADDAVGVLDSYGIDRAHLVGLSLGGMIAQIIAVKYPQRVLSMTLIASSIFGSDDNDRGLPPLDEKILAYHADGAALDWSDEEAVAKYLVKGSSLLCGSKHDFDENRVNKQVMREIKRANNLLSMFNHALLTGDDAYEGKLKEIIVPALVIHGTDDTILPLEHGVALAEEIPNASLLTLDGTGHEIHFDDWDTIIQAISNHTSLE
ncbi:alpha/beta fold hydrolase [Paenibacillus sp. NAIST15-1]|uniref:alpha/beta fold hydrolase n=1 Tax=Paenibacillus sp. NAIST15-1 TaxID=1605994 RepID=UPI00086C53B6|nr:alpha/beta hydrolase [Paenibacillus sp. NAIST15-1]GAV10785.1 carboxylesterase [Paenibacillus sp. NAIST15-1]